MGVVVLGLVIIVSIALLIYLVIVYSKEKSSDNDNYKHYSKGHNLWLPRKKGYAKFNMVGMFHRGLGRSNLGEFEGYAKAERSNAYDAYAVAIYNNGGKHLGYLPLWQ